MNWRRRSYSFDGLSSLGFVIVAWAVALVVCGFVLKLMWRVFMLGWRLV